MSNKDRAGSSNRTDPKVSHDQVRDTPDEMALDVANSLSFPASDPVSASNITRIEKAPESAPASKDHQNSHAVDHASKGGKTGG